MRKKGGKCLYSESHWTLLNCFCHWVKNIGLSYLYSVFFKSFLKFEDRFKPLVSLKKIETKFRNNPLECVTLCIICKMYFDFIRLKLIQNNSVQSSFLRKSMFFLIKAVTENKYFQYVLLLCLSLPSFNKSSIKMASIISIDNCILLL